MLALLATTFVVAVHVMSTTPSSSIYFNSEARLYHPSGIARLPTGYVTVVAGRYLKKCITNITISPVLLHPE
jgi:hypothetical protein